MTNPHAPTLRDAIVLGGGAAGLSAALMLGRARRDTLVIDAGSPRNRFVAHMHGVLGNEGSAPGDLLRRGREETAIYGVETTTGLAERVSEVPGGLEVTLDDGRVERARSLVVATGLTDELPSIPGLAERWGRTVLHCPYCHGHEVRDRRIGVLATNPMALHQARLVRQWSESVVLFSGALDGLDPADAQRLHARSVRVVEAPVVEILGTPDGPARVRTTDDAVTEVDAIFTAATPRPHDAFLSELGLERTELPFGLGDVLSVDQFGHTSHPRIWAIGNVTNPMANVPMSIGSGSFTGGAVNGALVEEEFDLAVAAERVGSTTADRGTVPSDAR